MIDKHYKEFLRYAVVIAVFLMLSVSVTYGYFNYMGTDVSADANVDFECSDSWGTYNATINFESVSNNADEVYVYYDGKTRSKKYDANKDTTIEINNIRSPELEVVAEDSINNQKVVYRVIADEKINCDPYSPQVS